MDVTLYAHMLIKNLLFWWGCFTFVVIIAVASEKSYLKGGKRKDAEKKKRISANIGWLLSLVAFGYCLYLTIPTVMDISHNDYISVHGEFNTQKMKYQISTWIVTDEGESISLKMPNGSSNMFPNGENSGTIWYAENSKYVLEFIPDEAG